MQSRSRDVELTTLSLLDRPAPDVLGELVRVVHASTGALGVRFNVLSSSHQYTLVDIDGADGVVELSESMCVRVIDSPQRTHAVTDARLDDRFRDHDIVRSGEIIGYAASLMVTSTGTPIGTLCIFEPEPREWDERVLATLEAVASTAVRAIEADRAQQSTHERLARMVRDSRELRRSNEHLSAFAGQVSHDLRGPLSAVSLGLELLDEQLSSMSVVPRDLSDDGTEQVSTEMLQSLVRSTRGGASRALHAINGLLEYSSAGAELRRQPVDVARLVDDTLVDLATRRGTTTVVVDELPVVQADPVQLRAVMQNLIGNAFKHGAGARGSVVVDAVRAGSGVVRLRVHDSGEGVPPESRDEIFGRGMRGADAVSAGLEGMGLGLDTCRRVMENHGGRIGVETSERMGGACFWVELPVARAIPSPACASSSPRISSPAP